MGFRVTLCCRGSSSFKNIRRPKSPYFARYQKTPAMRVGCHGGLSDNVQNGDFRQGNWRRPDPLPYWRLH